MHTGSANARRSLDPEFVGATIRAKKKSDEG